MTEEILEEETEVSWVDSKALESLRIECERLENRIGDLQDMGNDAAAEMRQQELRELETRIRFQEAKENHDRRMLLRNHLIQYKGGGYDGCFWEWCYMWVDDDAQAHSFASSGYRGCDTVDQIHDKIPPEDIYCYDFNNEDDRNSFAISCNDGHVVSVGQWLLENFRDYGEKLLVRCDCCEEKGVAGDCIHTGWRGNGGVGVDYEGFVCLDCQEGGRWESAQAKEDWDNWACRDFEKSLTETLEGMADDMDGDETEIERDIRENSEKHEYEPVVNMPYMLTGNPIPTPEQRLRDRILEIENWSSEQWWQLWRDADGESYMDGDSGTHFEIDGAVKNVIYRELFWDDPAVEKEKS